MKIANLWELLVLRVVLADRVMQMKTTLDAMKKQFDADPELVRKSSVKANLQRLVSEFFPKNYDGYDAGPQAGSLDNNGYIDIPEG